MNEKNTELSFEKETMPFINEIYRTAFRLTMSRNDAEDLVQETFLQAWKSFESFEIGTNCRAWLYKIFFNKYHHFRRRRFTRAKYTREADDLFFQNTASPPPAIPEHLTDKEIIRALNKLPEHYREVSLLADVHDFSYREIAEILDIPIGTVMSRLHRARNYLKKLLANIAGDYGIDSSSAKMSGPIFLPRFASIFLLLLT